MTSCVDEWLKQLWNTQSNKTEIVISWSCVKQRNFMQSFMQLIEIFEIIFRKLKENENWYGIMSKSKTYRVLSCIFNFSKLLLSLIHSLFTPNMEIMLSINHSHLSLLENTLQFVLYIIILAHFDMKDIFYRKILNKIIRFLHFKRCFVNPSNFWAIK